MTMLPFDDQRWKTSAVEQLPGATDETTLRQIFGFTKIGRLIADFSAEELDAVYLELFGGA